MENPVPLISGGFLLLTSFWAIGFKISVIIKSIKQAG